MSDHDRVTSEAVLAALLESFLKAATLDTGPNPMARASRALRHFRCYVYRGKGIEPGYGGKDIHVLEDRTVLRSTHREIVRLHGEGLDDTLIAEKVCRCESTVRRVLSEARKRTPASSGRK